MYVCSLKAEHQALAREHGRRVGRAEPRKLPPVPLHGSIIFAPAGELVLQPCAPWSEAARLALAGIHMSTDSADSTTIVTSSANG